MLSLEPCSAYSLGGKGASALGEKGSVCAGWNGGLSGKQRKRRNEINHHRKKIKIDSRKGDEVVVDVGLAHLTVDLSTNLDVASSCLGT